CRADSRCCVRRGDGDSFPPTTSPFVTPFEPPLSGSRAPVSAFARGIACRDRTCVDEHGGESGRGCRGSSLGRCPNVTHFQIPGSLGVVNPTRCFPRCMAG